MVVTLNLGWKKCNKPILNIGIHQKSNGIFILKSKPRYTVKMNELYPNDVYEEQITLRVIELTRMIRSTMDDTTKAKDWLRRSWTAESRQAICNPTHRLGHLETGLLVNHLKSIWDQFDRGLIDQETRKKLIKIVNGISIIILDKNVNNNEMANEIRNLLSTDGNRFTVLSAASALFRATLAKGDVEAQNLVVAMNIKGGLIDTDFDDALNSVMVYDEWYKVLSTVLLTRNCFL
jgi:hypothetical protein